MHVAFIMVQNDLNLQRIRIPKIKETNESLASWKNTQQLLRREGKERWILDGYELIWCLGCSTSQNASSTKDKKATATCECAFSSFLWRETTRQQRACTILPIPIDWKEKEWRQHVWLQLQQQKRVLGIVKYPMVMMTMMQRMVLAEHESQLFENFEEDLFYTAGMWSEDEDGDVMLKSGVI